MKRNILIVFTAILCWVRAEAQQWTNYAAMGNDVKSIVVVAPSDIWFATQDGGANNYTGGMECKTYCGGSNNARGGYAAAALDVQGNEGSGNGMAKDMNKQIAVQEKAKVETMAAPKSVAATVNNTSVTSAAVEPTNSNVVQTYGNKTREEMLQKFPTAIQLGAFGAPKWESFSQFAKFGKVISYKNDKNINVVWITGFANHAAAEAVLPQVKSIPGFENAYITGK